MNWVDVTIGFVLIISALAGLRKGLSRELIGLAASILALILGLWFYHSAGAWLQPYVSAQWAASLGGFLLIFFAVLVAGALLSAVVSGFLKTVGLSPIDRVLGAAYGLARGFLLSFCAITALAAFLPSDSPGQLPEAVLQSRMAPYVMELSHVVAPLAPQGLKESFEHRYRQVKATWEKKTES